MNKYTADNSFIIDATGKHWPLDTPHPMPLPKGIGDRYDEDGLVLIVFGNPRVDWTSSFKDATHWLARRPLQPVPRPKTQKELDDEAFASWCKSVSTSNWVVMDIARSAWNAAIAYTRKGGTQ